MGNIVIYGARWCGDCARAKFFFDQHNIRYEYHDIDTEEGAIETVRKYNNHANDSIPVIIFEDGSFLIEPTYQDLAVKTKLD